MGKNIVHLNDGEDFGASHFGSGQMREFGFHGSNQSAPRTHASKKAPASTKAKPFADGGHAMGAPHIQPHADGSHTVHHSDGRRTHHRDDGSFTRFHPDGMTEEFDAKGGHVTHHMDGSSVHHHEDGAITHNHPDGSVKHSEPGYADGGMVGGPGGPQMGGPTGMTTMAPPGVMGHSPMGTPPMSSVPMGPPGGGLPGALNADHHMGGAADDHGRGFGGIETNHGGIDPNHMGPGPSPRYGVPMPGTAAHREVSDLPPTFPHIGFKHGGKVDGDEAQDKHMVKKAVRQHENHEHGGEHTNLKLARGGHIPGMKRPHAPRSHRGGPAMNTSPMNPDTTPTPKNMGRPGGGLPYGVQPSDEPGHTDDGDNAGSGVTAMRHGGHMKKGY